MGSTISRCTGKESDTDDLDLDLDVDRAIDDLAGAGDATAGARFRRAPVQIKFTTG